MGATKLRISPRTWVRSVSWSRSGSCGRAQAVVVTVGIVATLCLALGACSTDSLAEPDLAPLLTTLTSPEPRVQESGLAPALRSDEAVPQPILPTGSTLSVVPGTWKVVKTDAWKHPYLAEVQANLGRPNQESTRVSLRLVAMKDQWLLYETSPI